MAKIEAVVFPLEDCPICPLDDIAHFYYTNTVDKQLPLVWEYLGNSTVAIGSGLQTLEKKFTLDGSGIQAIRVNFAYNLQEGSCKVDTGNQHFFVDHDDLVFSVAKEGTW